ncbi:MAG: hypothetical protein L0338_13705 [Acidobacteria bacterium]|nr:hypothetical protein [Acidobacteriota bacterium]
MNLHEKGQNRLKTLVGFFAAEQGVARVVVDRRKSDSTSVAIRRSPPVEKE